VLAAIATLAVTLGETAIVTAFDCTLAGLAHDADEVTIQVTTSLFAKLVVVKVALFVPAFVLPIFH
jgi:hypothetical protein